MMNTGDAMSFQQRIMDLTKECCGYPCTSDTMTGSGLVNLQIRGMGKVINVCLSEMESEKSIYGVTKYIKTKIENATLEHQRGYAQ